MSCPNCDLRMKEIICDNQQVLHCESCGSSFFEENGINRITTRSAEQLSKKLSSSPEVIKPTFCPRDHASLLPIFDEETIPQGLSLMRCPTCHGVFTGPEDLLKFKRAQEAKIEYFRLWERPIPSLHAVLVFSFLLIVSTSAYVMLSTISRDGSTKTRATEIVERVTIIKSGRYTLVSFQTPLPHRSEIILLNKTTGAQTIKEIAKEPLLRHLITLTDVDPDEEIFYKIRLTDDKGKATETEEKKLEPSR